ncbi:MAG: hypothetical protein VX767_00495 [Candidatus Neomarinimicrobiota bacterium]|nr:hypothetical protein [Candidatus Neomarinimicrobiota bacterium]
MWEWVNTWDGQGGIWLVFDNERNTEDQLIAQYSLIPTPLSFFGKKYIAGKTENCMSHPDIRGKGIYFPHEKKYFEIAKNRFKVFFTTTGNIAKGVPGRIREKLGYRAFDDWVSYRVLIKSQLPPDSIIPMFPSFIKKNQMLGRIFAYFFSILLRGIPQPPKFTLTNQIKIFNDMDVSFSQIEDLWKRNKSRYGITVDRSALYLNWRLKDNPYHNHTFLCHYENDRLLGYAALVSELNTFLIIDIFADGKNKHIFRNLLNSVRKYAFQKGIVQVKCNTIKRSKFLVSVLKSAGFFNMGDLLNEYCRKKPTKPKQLFIYISEETDIKGNPWNNENWYLTDLVKEGRFYTVRRNV